MQKALSRKRVLTFNHHESYLVAMSGLPYDFDVVVRVQDQSLAWNSRARPVPKNFRLIDFEEAKSELKKNSYDVVIAHTIKTLILLFLIRVKSTVFVAHIPLLTADSFQWMKARLKKAMFLGYSWKNPTKFVAVSEMKKSSWGLSGEVIEFFPIPFPNEMLTAERKPDLVVVVGNQIKERGEEMGYALLESVSQKMNLRILGNNPSIPFGIVPSSFANFVDMFSSAQIYLYTIKGEYGDGYNTSLLEAMLLGIAVVTVPNPTSPIVHMVNGWIAHSEEGMIQAVNVLLQDPALRDRLAKAAKETVNQRFTQERFLERWQKVLSNA
jgi:hypothetical protein